MESKTMKKHMIVEESCIEEEGITVIPKLTTKNPDSDVIPLLTSKILSKVCKKHVDQDTAFDLNPEIMAQGNGSEEIHNNMDVKDGSSQRLNNMIMGEQHSSIKHEGLGVDYSDWSKIDLSTIDISTRPPGSKLLRPQSLVDFIKKALIQKDLEKLKIKKKSNFTQNVPHKRKKAINVYASLLRIGDWQNIPRHEGHLIAKCYFAKRRIVWEYLDGYLKKIEFTWSDIASIKATFRDAEPDILEIELKQPPTFSKETNIERQKKNTDWQTTYDFTNGAASTYRRHYLEFCDGNLSKYYSNLLEDDHFKMLSQKPYPSLSSLHFDPEPMHVGHQQSANLPSQLPNTGIPRTLDHHQYFENLPFQLPHTSIQRTIYPQSANCHPSQLPHSGNPRTIDPSLLPHSGNYPRTIETFSLGVGMNSPCLVNSFQPFDGNGAMNSFLHKTTLPDQGIQSLNRMEYQAEELPFTACTTPLPNFIPRRVFPSLPTYAAAPSSSHANNWKFENTGEYLMSDPDTAINNDVLWAANDMNPAESLINYTASQDWNPDSWIDDVQYNPDNGANSWTIPNSFKQSDTDPFK